MLATSDRTTFIPVLAAKTTTRTRVPVHREAASFRTNDFTSLVAKTTTRSRVPVQSWPPSLPNTQEIKGTWHHSITESTTSIGVSA